MSKNMTTIEYYEGLPSRVSKEDDTRDDMHAVSTSTGIISSSNTHLKKTHRHWHIYDVGLRENIRQVGDFIFYSMILFTACTLLFLK